MRPVIYIFVIVKFYHLIGMQASISRKLIDFDRLQVEIRLLTEIRGRGEEGETDKGEGISMGEEESGCIRQICVCVCLIGSPINPTFVPEIGTCTASDSYWNYNLNDIYKHTRLDR